MAHTGAVTQIVLVGLMGAGKSTVGRIVAERTGRSLVDTDTAIGAQTGKSVRELWEQGGEAAYRALESSTVLTALRGVSPVVIAAPGGVILDAEVRDALTGAFVAWLEVDPALLAARVKPDDHRPLLGDDPYAVLSEMAAARNDLYRSVADVVVEIGANVDATDAAEQVLDAYERRARRSDRL